MAAQEGTPTSAVVSGVWDFFRLVTQEGQKIRQCQHCPKSYLLNRGSTSRMRYHLRSEHPSLYAKFVRSSTQSKRQREQKMEEFEQAEQEAEVHDHCTPQKKQVCRKLAESPEGQGNTIVSVSEVHIGWSTSTRFWPVAHLVVGCSVTPLCTCRGGPFPSIHCWGPSAGDHQIRFHICEEQDPPSAWCNEARACQDLLGGLRWNLWCLLYLIHVDRSQSPILPFHNYPQHHCWLSAKEVLSLLHPHQRCTYCWSDFTGIGCWN